MSIIVANTGDLDAVRAAIGRLRGFNRALTKSGSADSLQSHDDAGMSMALGRQGGRQAELMVGWAELPRSPGHAFYDRLQAILIEAEFDRFAEHACAPYYAGRRGRPSLPPGRYFRMVDATRRRSATSRGSTASAGWSGAAPTACPCASSCAWAPRSRCRTIRGLCGRPRKAKPILASPQRRAAQAKRTEGLRRLVEAVVYVLRTGVAWEDLPERFGKPNSLYRRFGRWSRQGIWDALFASGIPEDELETVM